MLVHFGYQLLGAGKRYWIRDYDTTSRPTMCCERMDSEWGGVVDLGLSPGPRTPSHVCVVLVTAIDRMGSGDYLRTATPISYCPWCAEAIALHDDGPACPPEPSVPPSALDLPDIPSVGIPDIDLPDVSF